MDSFGPDRFENGRPMLLGGLRRRHDFAAAERGIRDQWRDFRAGGGVPGRVGADQYGVMCGHDAGGLEYMCGVEVESLAELPAGIGRMRVPPQRYAVFIHPDLRTPVPATWQKILAWLERGPYDSAHTPDFEVYRPGSDPVAGTGATEIWVGVVPAIPPGG